MLVNYSLELAKCSGILWYEIVFLLQVYGCTRVPGKTTTWLCAKSWGLSVWALRLAEHKYEDSQNWGAWENERSLWISCKAWWHTPWFHFLVQCPVPEHWEPGACRTAYRSLQPAHSLETYTLYAGWTNTDSQRRQGWGLCSIYQESFLETSPICHTELVCHYGISDNSTQCWLQGISNMEMNFFPWELLKVFLIWTRRHKPRWTVIHLKFQIYYLTDNDRQCKIDLLLWN